MSESTKDTKAPQVTSSNDHPTPVAIKSMAYGKHNRYSEAYYRDALTSATALVFIQFQKIKEYDWKAIYFAHDKSKMDAAKHNFYQVVRHELSGYHRKVVEELGSNEPQNIAMLASRINAMDECNKPYAAALSGYAFGGEQATGLPDAEFLLQALERMLGLVYILSTSDLHPDFSKLGDDHPIKGVINLIHNEYSHIWDEFFEFPLISSYHCSRLKSALLKTLKIDEKHEVFGFAAQLEGVTAEQAEEEGWDSPLRDPATTTWSEVEPQDHLCQGLAQLAYAEGPFTQCDLTKIMDPPIRDGGNTTEVGSAIKYAIKAVPTAPKLKSPLDPTYKPVRTQYISSFSDADMSYQLNVVNKKLKYHICPKNTPPLFRVTHSMAVSLAYTLKMSNYSSEKFPFKDFDEIEGVLALQQAIFKGAENPTLIEYYREKGLELQDFGKSDLDYYNSHWDDCATDLFNIFCQTHQLALVLGIHHDSNKDDAVHAKIVNRFPKHAVVWIHHNNPHKADKDGSFCGKWYGFDDGLYDRLQKGDVSKAPQDHHFEDEKTVTEVEDETN